MAAPIALSSTCRALTLTFEIFKLECSKSHIHVSSHSLLRRRRVSHPKDDISSASNNESSSRFPAHNNKSRQARTKSTPTVSGTFSHANRCEMRKDQYREAVNEHGKGYQISSSSAIKTKEKNNFMAGIGDSAPRYDKAGPSDKRLGRAMMLANSRKYRERTGKMVLEGRRLVSDALLAGAKADTIFFSQMANIEGLPLQGSRVNLVKVAYKDVKLWSDMATPQGILGVFRQPSYDKLRLDESGFEGRLPITLICDNIRDPGNLGTILRSAAAAACQKVLVSKGCVDVWEPKVLRAGTGAHFRIPVISNLGWPSIPNFLDQQGSVHIADCLRARSDAVADCGAHGVNAARDSGGGRGPASGWDAFVGAGIGENEGPRHTAPATVPYFSLDWISGASAIVVGGETEGVSPEAMELCADWGGRRVHVPMSSGVESLNAAMAMSIILFEAKRQLLVSEDTSCRHIKTW